MESPATSAAWTLRSWQGKRPRMLRSTGSQNLLLALLLLLIQGMHRTECGVDGIPLTPSGLRWPSPSPSSHQGGRFDVSDAPTGTLRPLTIFHAFDWRMQNVLHKLEYLRNAGYDAVQLSPIQKSIGSDQWWQRYQPVSHQHIEGLGSLDELKHLCMIAKERQIIIIADVVFNHMAVVAEGHEWKRAQHDHGFHEELMRRIEDRFRPLTRNDFNPWMECRQEDWDNENRFEVWGDSAWCDLKPTPRVIQIHLQHIDDLLRCGVRAFRVEAAKLLLLTYS